MAVSAVNDSPVRHVFGAAALVILGLSVAACGAGAASSAPESNMPSEMPMDSGMDGGQGGKTFTFGHPADAASADRTIEITAHDTLQFDPAEITVAVGETVTFRLYNPGAVVHELILGPARRAG